MSDTKYVSVWNPKNYLEFYDHDTSISVTAVISEKGIERPLKGLGFLIQKQGPAPTTIGTFYVSTFPGCKHIGVIHGMEKISTSVRECDAIRRLKRYVMDWLGFTVMQCVVNISNPKAVKNVDRSGYKYAYDFKAGEDTFAVYQRRTNDV